MGCAAAGNIRQGKNSKDYFPLAKEQMDKVFSVYKNYNRADFSALVSEGFNPLRSSFLNDVESTFTAANFIEINYFLNQVLTRNNKLSVDFKWQKKISNRDTGELLLREGKGQFVFRQEDGNWLLYQIKGDSPF